MKKLNEFLSYVVENKLTLDNVDIWENSGLIEFIEENKKQEVVEALVIASNIIIENFKTENSYCDDMSTTILPLISRIFMSKKDYGCGRIYEEFKFNKEKLECLLQTFSECYESSFEIFKKHFNDDIDIQAEFVVFFQNLYTQNENNKFKKLNKTKTI